MKSLLPQHKRIRAFSEIIPAGCKTDTGRFIYQI